MRELMQDYWSSRLEMTCNKTYGARKISTVTLIHTDSRWQ